MSKTNAYLARQAATRQAWVDAVTQNTTQQFFDFLCLVLNDPNVMGKDVFGAKRIVKIHHALQQADEKWGIAWNPQHPEADYYQDMLDANLKEIFGEVVPFRERYPHIKEINYNKPWKG